MTNRVNALTLVLGDDVREDDIEHLKAAVMQFRNVVAVESNVSNVTDYVAQARAKTELIQKLAEAIKS